MDERSERLDPRCEYFMRVFAEQWVAPWRVPSMLDLSRDASLMSLAFARLGFAVTRIRLADTSIEGLGERLAGQRGRFDLVCCYDVLEHLSDWRTLLARIAGRLRPGGLFLYSVEDRGGRTPRWLQGLGRWLRSAARPGEPRAHDRSPTAGELLAGLWSARLLPREMVSLESDARWWAEGGTVPAGARTFAGYAVREAQRPATVAPMRWEFRGTGERWLAARAVVPSLVARRGGQ